MALKSKNDPIPYILIIVGFIFLIFTIMALKNSYNYSHFSNVAKGNVVNLEKIISDDNETFHPWVKFTSVEGRAYVLHSKIGTKVAMYGIGDSVEVRYDPKNPSKAMLNSDIPSHLSQAFILGIISAIFFFIGGKRLFNKYKKLVF